MTTLHPFPEKSHMRWRRLDLLGKEEVRVERRVAGWHLAGDLEVEENDAKAALRYAVECDSAWCTRSALIEGTVDGKGVRFEFEADGAGSWKCNGVVVPAVAGALDIDLSFTPATNTLPIRRLALAVGASARVQSAWLRFPELRFERLDQTYTRETERAFRYHATVDGEPFVARLDIDAFGRVVRYEGLWEAELAEPSARPG